MKKEEKAPSKCELCQKAFSWLLRVHLCKRCQRNICADCGKSKRIIVGYKDNIPHRTCDVCEQDIQFQMKLCRSNNLEWNTMSLIGKDWMATIDNLEDMQKEMDYRGYLKEAFNLGPGDLNLKEIVEDLQEGKTDYEMFNYSTHEFFKTVQNEKTKSECRTNVKNVLFAHCVRNPLIGYTPGINLVAAYLLCFLEEEDAFWMLTHLIERIIPKDFYSKGASDVPFFGFYAESYAIKHLAIKHLELSDPLEQKSLFSFLDIILPALFMPLLVNTLNSECLFSVWDTMIRNKEFFIVDKTVLVLISHFKNIIISGDIGKVREFSETFTQEISFDKLLTKGCKVECCAKEIEEYRDIFEKDSQNLLSPSGKHTIQTITSLERLDDYELCEMQEKFAKLDKSNPERTVSKDEFSKMFFAVQTCKDPKLFPSLSETYSIFNFFDLNHDGYLSSEEFLACTALLLKGSLDEKLLFCFRFSDIGKKNHLTPKECATFLDVVCRMGLVISQDNPNPYLLILMAKFKRMICKSITKKSKIKYADVQDLINQSMLIRELRAAFLKTARKSTLAVIQKKKRSLSSPTNTKKEMIESRETATITAHKKPASFQIPLEGEKQENDSQFLMVSQEPENSKSAL